MEEQTATEEQQRKPSAGDEPNDGAGDSREPTADEDAGFDPRAGKPWWEVVSTWFRRAVVAIGGGGVAFFLAVWLNRALVALHYNLQKNPETGGIKLTIVTIIAGLVGAVIGMLGARDRWFDRFGEFTAAVAGSLVAIYLGVVIGATLGAFSHIHFHPGRVVAPLVLWTIITVVKQITDGLWPRFIQPRVSPETAAPSPTPAATGPIAREIAKSTESQRGTSIDHAAGSKRIESSPAKILPTSTPVGGSHQPDATGEWASHSGPVWDSQIPRQLGDARAHAEFQAMSNPSGIGVAVVRAYHQGDERAWQCVVGDGHAWHYIRVIGRGLGPLPNLGPADVEEAISLFSAALPKTSRLGHLVSASPLYIDRRMTLRSSSLG
jgi:hypothetical protein